jgi:hypothetical protein
MGEHRSSGRGPGLGDHFDLFVDVPLRGIGREQGGDEFPGHLVGGAVQIPQGQPDPALHLRRR